MAQIDANATKEQLAQMEREFARKREAAELRRASELARLSEERSTADACGNTWTYIVVDGSFARICACETSQEALVIPDELDGFPVREIDAEALSNLDAPRAITCANSINRIGAYAFRSCPNLRRLVLPFETSAFSSGWIARCPNMEELVLPGRLGVIGNDVLACPTVTYLIIGAHTRAVAPGAFGKSKLNRISIDERNEHLKTDGTCIFSRDGSELIALARSVKAYDVPLGCRRLAEKAFAGARELERVTLPEGLEHIGPFAFANSGITALECPSSLVEVASKACMNCRSLRRVRLNEELRAVGEGAFASSAVEELRIPASVREIGRAITERSEVRYAGAGATFSVSADNEVFFTDGHGCLYRRADDGVHLAEMLSPDATAYEVLPRTVAIDEKAFAYHASIEAVALPEGLMRIGGSAFRVCRKLREVSVPESLESIGADAFIDTALERFRIPAALVDIGRNALVTDGAHHEGVLPALREVVVSERNPRFFMHAGMLCRRTQSGTSVVVFTNSCASVDFPDTTEAVEDYAFNNAFGINELHLNARLSSIGACGLSVECAIKTVRIDVLEPIEGRSSFLLRFPNTSRSVHGFLLALGGFGHLYLPDIMAQYDNCIASSRNYHAPRDDDNASAYEQVKLIIARLQDSVLLTDANRKRYRDLIADNIEEICVDISRHDDRVTIAQLADLGLLNAENVASVIDAVNRLQDAAMTGYLLEMKRIRFGRAAVDFDL